MRIAPDHPRLRIIALACWVFASWWGVQVALVGGRGVSGWLIVAMALAAVVSFAVGIAFWLLSADRRAGVVFDSKGMLLNLGHSVAFVGWENIAEVGVCRHRSSLLALGSPRQIGIKLHNPQGYIQSYESRLPAASGPLAWALRLLQRLLRPLRWGDAAPTAENIARTRARTGYDLLIPEALLGGRAEAFAALVRAYRHSPQDRQRLKIGSSAV